MNTSEQLKAEAIKMFELKQRLFRVNRNRKRKSHKNLIRFKIGECRLMWIIGKGKPVNF